MCKTNFWHWWWWWYHDNDDEIDDDDDDDHDRARERIPTSMSLLEARERGCFIVKIRVNCGTSQRWYGLGSQAMRVLIIAIIDTKVLNLWSNKILKFLKHITAFIVFMY